LPAYTRIRRVFAAVAAMMAASLVWSGLVGASPARASQTGYSCPDVLFLGMRGDHDVAPNDPPPGSPPGTPLPMDGSGIGADVAAVDGTVKDWLAGSGITVAEEGIPYSTDPQSTAEKTADDYGSYSNNSGEGRITGGNVDAFVAGIHQACPDTFLVVVAQSLGSLILHYAYQVPSIANLIVMFGDPLHWPGASIDGSCVNYVKYYCDTSVYDNSGYGLGTGKEPTSGLISALIALAARIPAREVPQQYPNDLLDHADNASSWCLNNDGVCGSGWPDPVVHAGGPLSAHTKYRFTPSILDDAAYGVVNEISSWWNAQNSVNGLPIWTPPPAPVDSPPPPPPPRDGLFLYNSSSGASYTELPDGSGGWTGIQGPPFSTGWQVYPGSYATDGRAGLFVYNPGNGDNYTEFPDGAGGWYGIKGPSMSPGWQVYPGHFNGGSRTDLFLYNPSNGDNWVEVPDGAGGWAGIQGPYFSPGWQVYTGDFNGDGRTDLFVYNPSSGANYVEFANGSGGWSGVKGPYFSPGWQVYPGIYN
jgi:hypothetical protein